MTLTALAKMSTTVSGPIFIGELGFLVPWGIEGSMAVHAVALAALQRSSYEYRGFNPKVQSDCVNPWYGGVTRHWCTRMAERQKVGKLLGR